MLAGASSTFSRLPRIGAERSSEVVSDRQRQTGQKTRAEGTGEGSGAGRGEGSGAGRGEGRGEGSTGSPRGGACRGPLEGVRMGRPSGNRVSAPPCVPLTAGSAARRRCPRLEPVAAVPVPSLRIAAEATADGPVCYPWRGVLARLPRSLASPCSSRRRCPSSLGSRRAPGAHAPSYGPDTRTDVPRTESIDPRVLPGNLFEAVERTGTPGVLCRCAE